MKHFLKCISCGHVKEADVFGSAGNCKRCGGDLFKVMEREQSV